MALADTPRLRFDVTTNDWVLYAPARARRPHTVAPEPLVHELVGQSVRAAACPFCPGYEELSPTEVLRRSEPAGGWSVRVVRNKFPALSPSAPAERVESGRIFREMSGYGAHEVVIESPDHTRPLARQPLAQIERVLGAIHERFTTLMHDSRLRTIVVFKNHGERAGTSLAHPHWQLIATPVVPRSIRLKHQIAMDYFDRTSECLYAVIRDEELAASERVLAVNDHYVALLPFASRLPYQVQILPREQHSSFAQVAPDRLRPLAAILKDVLGRLDLALHDPHFNLTLDTVPIGDEEKGYFLWHIDVLPRISTPAGFELGSGMAINSVLPEEGVAALRAVVMPAANAG